MKTLNSVSQKIRILHKINKKGYFKQKCQASEKYTILPKVLGHPLLMKGLTTLVISMSTNLNV